MKIKDIPKDTKFRFAHYYKYSFIFETDEWTLYAYDSDLYKRYVLPEMSLESIEKEFSEIEIIKK
jgi:hypothetical protein